ncbi:MAG TPA: SCO family protein [Pseudomonadales bacterium]
MTSSHWTADTLIAILALTLCITTVPVPAAASPASPAELPASEVVQPKTDEEIAREYFSDLPLLTHDGREVRFFSDLLKDHVVVINSFFTHGQTIAPGQHQVLMRLQEMLQESLGREVFIISITVDPERDTVERLNEYVAGLELNPKPGWVFVTGKPENIDWVNSKLGQHVEELEDHKGIYLAGNVKTTLWMKVPAHGQPLDLYRTIQRLLEDQGEPTND